MVSEDDQDNDDDDNGVDDDGAWFWLIVAISRIYRFYTKRTKWKEDRQKY